MKKTLYMETTEVPAERTAGEITSALVGAGASQIATEYTDGQITSLRWMMRVNGIERLFSMPARVEPIYKILKGRSRNTWLSDQEKERMRQKARRVAWRQLLRWVLAQLAMIECGMAEPGEVFFPYIQHSNGQTLFEYFKDNGQRLLEAPEERPQ